ncbi:MAG: TolC family protein [Candidatus Omnitrophota bacterium]
MKSSKRVILSFLAVLLLSTASLAAEETLEWKACVDEAKRQNPALISAFENIKQYKAAKEVTRSAVMPQVSGSGSESTAKSAGGARSTTYDYSVTGQQLLFDGFKTSFDLSAAERNIISSKYNYDVTSSNIRLSLRTAFANLLTAQEFLKVAQGIEARRKQNLELVKLRYEGGREHRGSLLTSEADLAEASYEVRQATRDIYVAQRQLTKELGRSLFVPMTAQGDFEVRDQDVSLTDFEDLAETTPLLQQLIAKKESAKFGLNAAYADFFPQVYANANIGNTNTRWFPDRNEWSLGTSLSLPIFDGGNRFAAVSQAKAVLGQAKENERSGRDGVIYTLSNTWAALQDAVENVLVRKKYLYATEERARIAEAEYSVGLMSFDNWIIIEDNLVSAKKSLVSAQLGALIAEATWIQAKGGTLDYDKK